MRLKRFSFTVVFVTYFLQSQRYCFLLILFFGKVIDMYRPDQFPKTCSCGKTHTEEEWKKLCYKGIQPGSHEGRRFYFDCEMRDCTCESTMSVQLKEVSDERA